MFSLVPCAEPDHLLSRRRRVVASASARDGCLFGGRWLASAGWWGPVHLHSTTYTWHSSSLISLDIRVLWWGEERRLWIPMRCDVCIFFLQLRASQRRWSMCELVRIQVPELKIFQKPRKCLFLIFIGVVHQRLPVHTLSWGGASVCALFIFER